MRNTVINFLMKYISLELCRTRPVVQRVKKRRRTVSASDPPRKLEELHLQLSQSLNDNSQNYCSQVSAAAADLHFLYLLSVEGGGVPVKAGVLIALAGIRHGARVEEIMTALVIFSLRLPEVRLTEKIG